MAVFTDPVIVFLGSLIIGAFGVYVGGVVVTGKSDYATALLTALVGAIVWSLASYFLWGVPYIGPLLTLGAYLLVIKWQYGASWLQSGAIAVLAWVVGLGVLSVLSTGGIGSLEAVGIPRF